MTAVLAPKHNFPLVQFTSYLERQDWKLINENDRWIVFGSDHPVDIMLPKNPTVPDFEVYVDHALKTLSSAAKIPVAALWNDIMRNGSDILNMRLIHESDFDSLPWRLAHTAMSGVQNLFAGAALAESKGPQPFYRRVRSNPGNILDNIRFGHTFAGSFGYRVESPLNLQGAGQQDLFPLQRRIMERIVRGLLFADEAARLQDVSPLLEGYNTGFSANMCDAFVDLSRTHSGIEVDFSVHWSSDIGSI